MKSTLAVAALACVLLASSEAGAWMHHGGWGYGGYHHGWGYGGWGHGYGWHRWNNGWGWGGGNCRLQCNPYRCWRVCW